MAKKSGLGQQFYIGGYDLSGDVGAMNNCGSPRPQLEVTGISSSAIERVNGPSDGIMEFASYFNDAALAAHVALSPLPTANVIALYAMGQAVGDIAAALVAKQVNYDFQRPNDGSMQATVQCLAAAGFPLEWMTMLSAGQDTHASATSSASRDDGASSSNGLRAVLQIFDIASGTPTVVIEDSANDSTWATLVSFSAVADGAEPTAERGTVTGTVNRYLRYTTTGTFTNLDFAVAVQRGTAQDDVSLA